MTARDRRAVRDFQHAVVLAAIFLLGAGLGVAMFVACVGPAKADDADDLARAAAHEAGTGVSADEVAAIYAVARARCPACRHPLRRQMPRFFAGRTSRPEFLTLRLPERLLELARAVIAGEVRHRCNGFPIGWGGPRIDHGLLARVRDRWLDCGETRNVFFRRRR